MTGGEWSILVTLIVGFAGTIAQLFAAHAKAGRASDDLISMREQDRLDREQVARDLLAQQRLELQMLHEKTEAAAIELRYRLDSNAKIAAVQQAAVVKALDIQDRKLDANTQLTERSAQRADDAYKEANTVNLKLEKIGIDNIAEKKEQAGKQDRTEVIVTDTQAKVTEVRDHIIDEEERMGKPSIMRK